MEHVQRLRNLLELGAFRVLLPRSTWVRTGQPVYAEHVYEVNYLVGSTVVSKDNARFPSRYVITVPRGSDGVQVPRELRGGNPARQNAHQATLRPFAEALKGFLGSGSLTLSEVGTRLSQVPGFRAAMQVQRVGGTGVMQRFVTLFPDFVLEGRTPHTRVRLTEIARQARAEPRRRLNVKTTPGYSFSCII